jgi:hypothetical protein
VTDVLSAGEVAAEPRRIRLSRPVTWIVVGVLAAGVVAVPYARSRLATDSARWLRDEWALRAAYDDARVAVIDAVAARAGVLDLAVVEQATRLADREEATALDRIAGRIAGHRTWSGAVSRARGDAVRALRGEVASLRQDATAVHPITGYLFVADVDQLVQRASARIAGMDRAQQLAPAASVAPTLPPAGSALARLNHATDFPTGLSLVLSDNDRLELLDLDTGVGTPLQLPNGDAELRSWSGRLMLSTGHGVRALTAQGRTQTRYTRTYAELLSSAGPDVWLSARRGVRRFAADGQPMTGWIPTPARTTAVAATGANVVLSQVRDEVAVVTDLWNPVTGARRKLPPTCYAGWAAAGRTVVALPCADDRSVVWVDTVTGAMRHIPLPQPVADPTIDGPSPLSPDGRQLAVVLGRGRPRSGLLDIRTGRFEASHVDPTLGAAGWSPDGRWVLLADPESFGGSTPPRVALWRPYDGRRTSLRLGPGLSLSGWVDLLQHSVG